MEKAYFDPQYVWGAPSEEVEQMDREIIEKMTCHRGHPLKAGFWHIPGGSGSSYVESYIAQGVCYICGYTRQI